MLTGTELLTRFKELTGTVTKPEIIRACGYVTTTPSGKERINCTAFYAALLEAKGVEFDNAPRKPGRKLPYRTKVQFNGNLQVGEAYLRQMGFEPGDEFEIKLGRKQITLVPILPD